MLLVLSFVFLLSVSEVISQCPPSSGIYLLRDGICYTNGSYFWDNSVNAVTEAISCVLPGTSLTTGQWVRVADPDDPVDCNSNSASDPFRCTSVTSPNATLSLYLAQGLTVDQEGWYKCCLPTDCSTSGTNIIFANIFRFAEIESFTVADLPSDMTVYPQEYKLNCTKIGLYSYGISMSIGSTALASYTSCNDQSSTCPGTELVSFSYTIRYTVNITWDGMNVSSGSISQSTTGDQMYQCVVQVTDQPTRTRDVIVKVPATAPSSLTEVNKTATTITVSWTALDSSDADGYVVNVTSDTDTVQTVQVEGSSNNTITLDELSALTTYIITVRAYQQLLGSASTISVFTHICQQEGIYLAHDGNCYIVGSYFWDSNVNAANEAISCVLPGTSLTTGQWVRVVDPDDPVDCNSNSASDPFLCTNVTSPAATINLYLAQGLTTTTEGWYKYCLPTDCSDPNTNIIFANIFRFAEIESFTVADLPSDMTVYPQEYKLNCTKIGLYSYGISMSIGNTALASYTNYNDQNSNCPGTELVSSSYTVRYTVNITWNGMTVSNGSISQSTTGDQMYQCRVADSPDANAIRIRNITIKVPATAPSSLTEVNKTATTITVSWTALDSSDADGYVVNVTSDTDTVQTVQVEGSSNNTITLDGLRELTTYSITVRAYQQLLGPASSAISVFTHICQQEGIYLAYDGNCYPNGSYFFDNIVNEVIEAISCVLPDSNLTTGQWVRVADPDDPVDCNSNSASDPFRCTNVTSPAATINLYLAQGLSNSEEGWYKCCLSTDCSNANDIIFTNIFRYAEIESFTIGDLPSDMTVYPQEYKLNCIKIGFDRYDGISMSIGSTALASYTNCDDRTNTCSGTVLVSINPNTLRYTVNITCPWNECQ
uniref:Fibronectin type-III domain-containing protein n=1 Tax=Amphimedon queenslandica TaxID=400682 RepID=A0A1X7T8H8_AMPQE